MKKTSSASWTNPDLAAASNSDLFELYGCILDELQRERHVIRTRNAPVGDYAEWLVNEALGGQLAPNNVKSYDILLGHLGDDDSKKVQVKARVVSPTPTRGQLQTSPFRSDAFDIAALVLVDARDYDVRQAVLLPVAQVRAHWQYANSVQAHRLFMTPDVMGHPVAEDITERLRDAGRGRGRFN